MATILVDFDGTCIPSLPMGGYTDYNTGAEKVLIDLIKNGHNIVLWTVRNESDNNPYNCIFFSLNQSIASCNEVFPLNCLLTVLYGLLIDSFLTVHKTILWPFFIKSINTLSAPVS